MPEISLIVFIKGRKHHKKVDSGCPVHMLLNTLVATYERIDNAEGYELYWLNNGYPDQALDRNSLLGNIPHIQHASLELRKKGTRSALSIEDFDQTVIVTGSDISTSFNQDMRPKLYRNRLKCSVEIAKGQRITVSEDQGLRINRNLVENYLSRGDRFKIWIKGLSSQETALQFISRDSHCEIYLDSYLNRWIMSVGKASIYIEARQYNSGQHIQLNPGLTTVRLGREGIFISVHLSDI